MFVFWFLIALLFLVFELGHPGLLFFISFACGAFAAGLASLTSINFVLQWGVFLVVTVGALLVLRRWVAQRTAHTSSHEKSNIYALEGKRGVVIKEISAQHPGQVNLNGEIWLARTLHNESVAVGVEVKVLYVKGAHVVVDSIKN